MKAKTAIAVAPAATPNSAFPTMYPTTDPITAATTMVPATPAAMSQRLALVLIRMAW